MTENDSTVHGVSSTPPVESAATPRVTTLADAFGGKQGLLDSGLPTAVFILAFTLTRQMTPALWAAVGVGGVLAVIRLARRDTVQHAVTGFIGVAVAAYIAHKTGRPQNIVLPNLLINLGYALAFAISLVVRWPLLGVVLGPIFGEGTAWRGDAVRHRAYARATSLWLAMFAIRLAILVPLYLSGQLVALGVGRLLLGYPLYLLIAWLSWLIIKQTRPVMAPRGSDA